MPSAKKNKGRARREKALIAERREMRGCTHGLQPLPKGHVCQQFLDAFCASWKKTVRKYGRDCIFNPKLARPWKEGERCEGPHCYLAAGSAFKAGQEKYPEASSVTLKAAFLAHGTDLLLDGSCELAREVAAGAEQAVAGGIAMTLIAIESDEWLYNERGLSRRDKETIMKERDVLMGCERSQVEFFHERVQCSCLDSKLAAVQSLPRTAVCHHCSKRGERKSFLICSGCDRMQCCSKRCRKADWPLHKEICKEYQHDNLREEDSDNADSRGSQRTLCTVLAGMAITIVGLSVIGLMLSTLDEEEANFIDQYY